MAEKRKSAQDWRKAYDDAKAKVTRVENQISERLLSLVNANPDVVVKTKEGADIKVGHMNTVFVAHITTAQRLDFIEQIEKHLADQHPHKQLTIQHVQEPVDDVPEKEICQCEEITEETYIADGEWHCPHCGLQLFR